MLPFPPSDSDWDEFLTRSPLGQFQQSAAWARVKALDGWKLHRVRFPVRDGDSGGYQMLWKQSRLGRIGYISKGPVLPRETPETIRAALDSVISAARSLRLAALIVQPPDASQMGSDPFIQAGFCPWPLASIIDCTLIADVTGAPEDIDSRMTRRVRQEDRQARKRGVAIRHGQRQDLTVFFDLMKISCARQNSSPNPSRVELLERLWDEFYPRIHLGLAVVGNQPVAGLLMIGFGRRLTFWKKGWNNTHGEAHPNTALNVEFLRWANTQGYQEVDFVGGERSLVTALASGTPLTETHIQSRHLFNLRLGAKPKPLPEGRLLVVNRGLAPIFKLATRIPWIRNLVQNRITSA